MACDRMRELAFLAVDGELTEAERAELAAHVATCAECRAAQVAAGRVASGVRQLAPPPVPLGFAERTLKRVEASGSPRRLPRPLPLMVPIAAVAATLVAAAIFVVELRRPRAPDASTVASAPQAQEPAAPAAESPSGGFAAGDRSGGVSAGKLETKPGAAEESDRERRLELSDEQKAVKEEVEKAKQGSDSNWKSGNLTALLAAGSPADALRRIVAMKDAEPLKDAVTGDLDEAPAKRPDAAPAKRPDAAKDDEVADKGDAKSRAEHKEDAPAPTLRFLRVHGAAGDARSFDELLAKREVRDGAGRVVLDLDEEEAKSLRPRLDAGGLKCEELTSAEWFRAAQAAASNEGLLAHAPPAPNPAPTTNAPAGRASGAAKSESTGAPKSEPISRGEPRGKLGAPKKADETRKSAPIDATGGGGGGVGTLPKRRERWFLLFSSG